MGIRKNFLYKYCILIIFFLTPLSFAHDHPAQNNANTNTIYLPSSVLIHALVMTIVLLVTFPFGYGLILYKKYNAHKVVQVLNIITIALLGTYAHYKFSSHTTVHAKLGRIIIIILIIQLIIPLLKYLYSGFKLSSSNILFNIHKYNGIIMVILLFPLQWLIGLWHTMTNTDLMDNSWNIGHIGPGFTFYLLGVIYIWNHDNVNLVKKYEMFILIVFCSLEAYLELLKPFVSSSGYHHIFIDMLYIFGGIVLVIFHCFSYLKINNSDINKWHHYTIGFCTMVYGYTLMNHVHKGNTEEGIVGIHKLAGYIIFVGGAFRAYGNVYMGGVIAIIHGVLLTSSNPIVTNAWISGTPFPGEGYVMVTFMLGFYCAAIHSLLSYLKKFNDDNNSDNKNTNKIIVDNNVTITTTNNNNNNNYHHHHHHTNNDTDHKLENMNNLVILNNGNKSELARLINNDNNEGNEKDYIDDTL